tara:strand:- start:5914 stop:6693 length:780 start_codon:yes stop_codon:yes gene_type:complete
MHKIVLVTGGFDPLHSGHIEYFKSAKLLGDHLAVGVNSDDWLVRKKGKEFMSYKDRCNIIKELSCVDSIVPVLNDDKFDDAGGAIFHLLSTTGNDTKIIVANGGDRGQGNVPEQKTFDNNRRVEFVYGVGGDSKTNSSSWILDEWKTQKTEREWGHWRVLDHKPNQGYKVKELVIYPGKSLSDQRHFKRSEQWITLEGCVDMQTEYNGYVNNIQLIPHGLPYEIGKQVWHKASNPGTVNAHVLEIQWGTECVEEDIERK